MFSGCDRVPPASRRLSTTGKAQLRAARRARASSSVRESSRTFRPRFAEINDPSDAEYGLAGLAPAAIELRPF
jgi:hypothetical protein